MHNSLFVFAFIFGFNFSALASTHGGGALSVANSSIASPKEMVYFHGEEQGVVKLAYAQLVNKHWEIKKVLITALELTSEEISALELSKNLNQWTEIR